MLDRLRDLWAERPAVVAAAVIAPVAFVITLVVLFLAVGGNDAGAPQEQSVSQAVESEQSTQQEADSPTQEATIIVQTSASDEQQQSVAQADQSSSEGAQSEGAQDATSQSGAQPAGDSGQDQSTAPDAAQEDDGPLMISGFTIQPLEAVLVETIDEEALRHGTDGSEGGILPVDNGVVVSSGEEHQTTWELIVPSAGLKSSIVKVGRTNTGAMGSPDNPYVIGWLDSSAVPGEVGNALLAGHRDFEDLSGNVGTGVCWELVNTVVGDQMIVRDNENDIYYVYTVTEASTVNPRDPDSARYLRNTDEPVITLITCTGSFNADTHQYSHRLVVVGVLAAVASPDA